MHFHIMTLFPEMIESGLNTSIIGRAADAGLISIEAVNIRDFTNDIHGHVDDYPYGGGAGMVMQAQPIYDCYQYLCSNIEARKAGQETKSQPLNENGADPETEDLQEKSSHEKPHVIYMSPAGQPFDQNKARQLAAYEDLIILCGHYEGVDERVIDMIVDEEISIGDYVLTGGELAAMVVTDAVSRMIKGVLTNEESGATESFSDGLLEYPQYTRPQEFMGRRVPDILLSGHHANIEAWRHEQALERTRARRPDLLDKPEQ